MNTTQYLIEFRQDVNEATSNNSSETKLIFLLIREMRIRKFLDSFLTAYHNSRIKLIINGETSLQRWCKYNYSVWSIFDRCVQWAATKEGTIFWWHLYRRDNEFSKQLHDNLVANAKILSTNSEIMQEPHLNATIHGLFPKF